MVTGIADKGGFLIVRTGLLPIPQAALLVSSAGSLPLALSAVADGAVVREPGTGLIVDVDIFVESGDQSSAFLNLLSNGGNTKYGEKYTII